IRDFVTLRLVLATLRAKGAHRSQLSSILRAHLTSLHARPDVYIVIPQRFLKVHRLASPSETMSSMLTFISYVQHACDERQIATRLQVQERIPRSIQNKLIFSHHTYRDDTFT